MADMIPKAEFLKKIVEMQSAADLMIEGQLICEKCFMIKRCSVHQSDWRERTCYCDYESPMFDAD